MGPLPPSTTLFPYTTLFRSDGRTVRLEIVEHAPSIGVLALKDDGTALLVRQYRHSAGETLRGFPWRLAQVQARSEEHTSELQSLTNLVCRLLLEKKKQERTT